MTIEERAREFVERHIKTLPIAVRLSGISEDEKREATDLCARFAPIAVREFVERVNSPQLVDVDFDVAARDVFREMFGKEIGEEVGE